MTKAEIRKVATMQRKWLSESQIEDYSLQLLGQFSLLDFSSVATIHIFLPIMEKKEPDTFLFIDWLGANYPDIKIIVPKADFDTSLMTNYLYQGKDSLVKNQYNILEPVQGQLYFGEVDMVLVPMLAFDKVGYRVGYGKGFYDRFLEGLATKRVGLCFFEPIDGISDVNEHDVSLDLCITPNKIYSF